MAKKLVKFQRSTVTMPDGKEKELIHHPGTKEDPALGWIIIVGALLGIIVLVACLLLKGGDGVS